MQLKKKSKDIIYLSGPMSGYSEYNRVEFNRVTKLLRQRYETVINPIEIDALIPFRKKNPTWFDYMKRDIQIMLGKKVHTIVLLNDWTKSRGAKAEVFVGRELLDAKVKKFTEKKDRWYLSSMEIDTHIKYKR